MTRLQKAKKRKKIKPFNHCFDMGKKAYRFHTTCSETNKLCPRQHTATGLRKRKCRTWCMRMPRCADQQLRERARSRSGATCLFPRKLRAKRGPRAGARAAAAATAAAAPGTSCRHARDTAPQPRCRRTPRPSAAGGAARQPHGTQRRRPELQVVHAGPRRHDRELEKPPPRAPLSRARLLPLLRRLARGALSPAAHGRRRRRRARSLHAPGASCPRTTAAQLATAACRALPRRSPRFIARCSSAAQQRSAGNRGASRNRVSRAICAYHTAAPRAIHDQFSCGWPGLRIRAHFSVFFLVFV